MAGMGTARMTACSGRGKCMIRTSALALFLGLAGAVVPPIAGYAQNYSFSNVRVTGNNFVDTATIVSYAGIGRGQAITAGQLNDAYQRIMNSGLFEAVTITPQGSTLVINVTEYPMINQISIEGNRRLDDDRLTKVIKSQARRVYSPSQAEADAQAITDTYRNAGRVAAIVEPKIIKRSDNRVDLVFEVREGGVSEIQSIDFSGNRAFSDSRLRRVLASKQAGLLRIFVQSDNYVEDRLEFDKQLLTDFYRSRGYADFQVLSATTEFSRERDGFFVNINVHEGQQYRYGTVTVATNLTDIDTAAYQAALRMDPGDIYSPVVLDNNVTRLEQLAVDQGKNFIRVEPRFTRHEETGIIDVQFYISRGERVFVERIDIEGNTTTLDQVVRRQFRIVEGDPYNPREVRQTAERIKALGYFEDATVNPRPGTRPDQVILDVDVKEKPTGSLTFGVSYGVDSGVGFSIGFSEANFLGRGQYLGLNVSTIDRDTSSSVTFVEPFLLDRDLRFRFNAYYNVSSDSFNSTYDTRRIGLVPSLEFPVSELGRLELKYRISSDKIWNVDGPYTDSNGDYHSGSSVILHREEDEGSLSSSAVGYTYSFDNRLEGIDPEAGVLFRFGQEFVGVGGDNKGIITSLLIASETKAYNEEIVLRAEFEAGNVHMLDGQVSRVTDRYFLRGKMRGFSSNGIGPRDLAVDNRDALGGNNFAVMRLESQFPLGLPEEYGIQGGFFWDVGSIWSLDDVRGGPVGGPVTNVDDSLHWRSAIGFSVFWNTPIGPLRFNFSRALVKEDYDREQNFDLTVSTRF